MVTQQYTLMPVRNEHVPAALRFLLDLEEGRGRVLDLPDGWTSDLIRHQYGRTSKNMKKLQKYLAAHPGDRFTGDALAAAIGLPYGWNSIAGMLGGYQRLVQNHYALRNWPFDFDPDADGEWKYSMRQDVADIIKAL